MSRQQEWLLVSRYLANDLTEEEAAQLKKQMEEEPSLKEMVDGSLQIWNEAPRLAAARKPHRSKAHIQEAIKRMDTRLQQEATAMPARQTNVSRKIPLTTWAARLAASLLLLLGVFAGYQYLYNATGSSGAAWQTVASLPGQQQQVTLPDGTLVYLNYASTLSYPAEFTHERKVKLDGEAYFEVREGGLPFLVESHGTTTRVVGTAFNLRAYDSENKIALLVTEGKVVFASGQNNEEMLLKPREGLEYDKQTASVSPGVFLQDEITGWKEQKLFFSDASFQNVCAELSRWYDKDFTVQGNSLKGQKFTGSFQGQTLGEVVRRLSLALDFEYTITEDSVLIKAE